MLEKPSHTILSFVLRNLIKASYVAAEAYMVAYMLIVRS